MCGVGKILKIVDAVKVKILFFKILFLPCKIKMQTKAEQSVVEHINSLYFCVKYIFVWVLSHLVKTQNGGPRGSENASSQFLPSFLAKKGNSRCYFWLLAKIRVFSHLQHNLSCFSVIV